MSLAFTRFKMNLTTQVVDYARSFCDGCNVVLNTVAVPMRRVKNRIMMETPWLTVVIAAVFFGVIPLVGYPVLKPLMMNDTRRVTEEERVRLCLQKGLDPYPYMRAKKYVYGNSVTALSWEGQVPHDSAPEMRSVDEFDRRKKELVDVVDGDMDMSVQRLLQMREEDKKIIRKMTGLSPEPKNLVFPERSGVDVLQS